MRDPDFFRFLRYTGPDFHVLISRDRGIVNGVATVCLRDGYVQGKPGKVAYLGDLRIGFSRALVTTWRECYGALLDELALPALTAVIDENHGAQNALLQSKKNSFVYEPIARYHMVNVLFRLPSFGKRSESFSFEQGASARLPELHGFLDRQNRAKAFGFSNGEWGRRLERWDGLRAESFYLVRDRGKLVGCFAIWNPALAKRNLIEKFPIGYRLLAPFMNVPKIGSALRTDYLTHLEIDRTLSQGERSEVFRAIFDGYYRSHRDPKAVISFCDFSSNDFHRHSLGRAYMIQKIPMTLHRVFHRDLVPSPLSLEERREIGFEIALV